MIVAILQSSYLPWAGVLDMMDRCDVFVHHNDIQYTRSWRNRNRIRTPGGQGWTWLTVPVRLANGTATLINEVMVANERDWGRRHWALIYENYHRAPYFASYSAPYEDILTRRRWERLVELNEALLQVLLEQAGIACRCVHTEDLELGDTAKNERIIAICRALGADTWLANSACRSYVVPELYEDVGIKVVFHDYHPPAYPQQYEPFVSHLSAVDMIFNCGPDTLELIRGAREQTSSHG